MKLRFLFLFFLIPAIAFLQPSTDAAAPYFQNIGYPNLKLRLTDSTTIYTKENLPKHKTVVIIFFSPDCEHCQAEAKQVLAKKDSLQNLFMVWNASMVDEMSHVKKFYTKYGLNTMNNIVLGKEVDYYLPLHYKIETTPYAAIYKDEKLFAEFRNPTVDDLIAINNNTYKPIVNYAVFKPQPAQPIQPLKEIKKKKKKSKN